MCFRQDGFHVSPKDLVGINSARAYYANYLTGFSAITFTIKDVFGMGDKLVKHWNFKGTHTGLFFGIPATGKKVDRSYSKISFGVNRTDVAEASVVCWRLFVV